MKSLDEETRRLAEQYRDEIAHQFNAGLMRRTAVWLDLLMRNFFLSETNVDGLSHLRGIPEGTPVILSCVHKSHLDYVALGLSLYYRADKFVPATVAGKNLFHGMFEKLLPQVKGVCLDRERVTAKNLRSRENLLYLSTFYDYLMQEVVREGDAISIFPEGGRSYSGEIMPLSLGIFGIAKRALKESNGPVALMPVGVTYDRVTEDCRFDGLRKYKGWNEKAYRKYDKRGFIHHALLQPKSAVYIDFGEPMYLDDVRRMDELERELRTRMGKLIRVTPVALVCRALAGHRYVPLGDVIKHIRLDLRYVKKEGLRIGRGIRYRTASRVFKRSIEHLCNRVRTRDIIRLEKRDGTRVVKVRRKDVVTYYANTVAHLFVDSS